MKKILILFSLFLFLCTLSIAQNTNKTRARPSKNQSLADSVWMPGDILAHDTNPGMNTQNLRNKNKQEKLESYDIHGNTSNIESPRDAGTALPTGNRMAKPNRRKPGH